MVARNMVRGLLRSLRPHQWVKNVFVLLPLVFAQELFEARVLLGALAGFACFCALTSAVYLLNDLIDVEADRAHPVKKNRPIASGQLGEPIAMLAMAVLATAALIGGFFLGPWFLAVVGGYLANNIAYSLALKRVPYIDVLSITAGFELRVVAGALAAGVPPSSYLLLETFLLASFLGFGKRMHELVQQEKTGSPNSRKVLSSYSRRVVDVLLWVTGTATVGTYIVYSLDPHTRQQFGTDFLVISSIFALLGVFRFMQLVRNRPDTESPTEEMLKDIPFIANAVLWAGAVVAIIYFG